MARAGTLSYTFAAGISPAAGFARNVIIARSLGVEQFGLASFIILTSQFFDAVSDSGSDRFLIRGKEEPSEQMQAAVQGAMVVKGFLTTLLMLAATPLIARFLEQGAIQSAIYIISFVPLVTGFQHLDTRRLQKAHDFTVEARMIMASEVMSVCYALIFALVFKNFIAVSLVLLARSLTMTTLSHLLSRRRYALSFNLEHAPGLVQFGWPLMINGLLLFLASQGDRLVMGKSSGAAEFGAYTTAALLIGYPISIVQKIIGNFSFPQVVASLADPGSLAASERRIRLILLMVSLGILTGFLFLGPLVIKKVYGHSFFSSYAIVAAVGLLQVIRMARIAPSTVLLALGKTKQILTGNICRLLGILFASLVMGRTGSMEYAVVAYAGGEIVALAISQFLSSKSIGKGAVRGQGSALILVAVGVAVAFVGFKLNVLLGII